MELPIVAPAPVVTEHASVFRDLFDNHCQFRHFQHYLTGLIVLPNKSMANIARCILDSPDKTQRFSLSCGGPLAGGCRQSPPPPIHAPGDETPSAAAARLDCRPG